MSERYDLIVLGGGPGGVAAAIRGVQLGARVALIEEKWWGGLCLNRACVPTKLLAAATDRMAAFNLAGTMGFSGSAPAIDEPGLWAVKNQLVEYFSAGTRGLSQSHGVELVQGSGRLAGPGLVEVDGQSLTADKIILASGGEWLRPACPGGDAPGVINSTQFLDEENLPGRALLLGSGPWAVELAQFLTAAGKEVTVAEAGRDILPGFDQEISQRLRSIINQPPLTILNSCRLISLNQTQSGLEASLEVKGQEQTGTFDRVIYFDRRPGYDKLGLESLGLSDLDVNDYLETQAAGVFAVGDLAGKGEFLSHASSAMGLAAAENALGQPRPFSHRLVPRVAFTSPQAASVGLTEDQAEDLDYDVITGEATLSVNPMAMIQGMSNGVVKVVGEAEYGELLGVHILAPMATEIISAGCLALQLEATLAELAGSIIAHPTLAESLVEAAREALGRQVFLPK